MSRIDDLIAEFCPRGVAYRTLGEVGELIRGRRFTGSSQLSVVEASVTDGVAGSG